MLKSRMAVLAAVLTVAFPASQSLAQVSANNWGTLVVVPGYGEVKHANDEARVTWMLEEQDRDKAQAASRVNLKMKQGIELLKSADPKATLRTRNYFTYPVYSEDQRQNTKNRQPVGWRVGQYLELVTTNLDGLPKTVAAAQRIFALNGLSFGLSDATRRQLDEKAIEASYRNLTERIGSIAKVMGRNVTDAVMDTVDFEGSGNFVPQQEMGAPKLMRSAAAAADAGQIEEPSFEAGETTLGMRIVGRVRFR